MVAPNSTKVRQTKVAVNWFYDPARSQWRFHPVGPSHRAEHISLDRESGEEMPSSTVDAKGWVRADIALKSIPEAKESAPEVVCDLYGLPKPTPKKADAKEEAA